jgi:hypothetical protein
MITHQRGAIQEPIAVGIGLRLASGGCYSIMAALLKLASARRVVALEMLFYRAIFGLPVVLLWVLASQGTGDQRQFPVPHPRQWQIHH